MTSQVSMPKSTNKSVFGFLAFLMLTFATSASAGVTDLADKPLTSSNASNVKPNIMLLMDTSTSMGFTHMPSGLEKNASTQAIGYKSYQCNSIYYNRTTKYLLPKRADGSSFPTPSFNSAPADYYITGNSVSVNLATNFTAYDALTLERARDGDTPQAAYYYIYSGSAATKFDTAPCTDADTGAPGTSGSVATVGGNWTRVLVSTSSGQGTTVNELENFAIWYSYYRTRLAMTKSALSSAFAPLTDKYRVGFVTADPGTPVAPAKYQAIKDFNATNKTDWYNKVFSQTVGGTSPMRQGLARVGRHFAGKLDGINAQMEPDPMQYACQRNYTFMTTDGYWNSGDAERLPRNPGGVFIGPVGLDGINQVGQQDGTLTDATGNTPRPIFDGSTNQQRVITNKINTYSWAGCVGPEAIKTSTQKTAVITGQIKTENQTKLATQQNLQRTSTVNASTTQTFKTTAVTNQITTRFDETKSSVSASTTQRLESTSQYYQFTTQLTKNEFRINRTTFQDLTSTNQFRVATSQTTRRQEYVTAATTQSTGGTSQNLVSTTQRLLSTSQASTTTSVSTAQRLQTTTRTDQTVSRWLKSTSQLNVFNGESNVPSDTCTPVAGSISCRTIVTGPTPVATCTPETRSAGNAWTTVTCVNEVISGPVAVASCTGVAATAGNGYQSTTCTPVNTNSVPVASCTPSTASSGNSFTTTTCANNNTGPTVTASCTPVAAGSGNNFTATTCTSVANTPVTTGPTAVQTCTPAAPSSGNNFTTTRCSNNNTSPTAVQSCTGTNAPAAATSGNNWVATSCSPTTTSGFVQDCSGANAPATATSGNNWVTRTCTTNNVPATAVASCSPLTGNAGNGWLTRTCNTVVTSPTAGVASCANVTGSGPGFLNTICNTINIGPTPQLAVCLAIPAGSGNNWTATTCPNVTTGPIATSSCTTAPATSPNFISTTCSTNNTGPTPVAPTSCAPQGRTSGNNWTQTLCTPPAGYPTSVAVASCTPSTASSGNSWTDTTCTNPATPTIFVAFCAVGSNTTAGGLTTTCGRNFFTNIAVATCTPQTGSALNNWLDRTCTNNNTGPTLVASCIPGTSGSFVNTTCTTNPISGPTAVATCTPVAPTSGNSFVRTICNTVTTGPTAMLPASCSAVPAGAGNNWTATTCPVNTTGPTAVQGSTCTSNTPPLAGNGFVATTCDMRVSTTAVISCSNLSPNSGNQWLTRACQTVNTPYVPVASCTPVGATSGNRFVATQCTTAPTGPTAAASCTPIPASAGNNFVATTCSNSPTTNTAVVSCTPSVGGAPDYINTACSTNPASTTTLVVSCTAGTNASNLTTACSESVVTATVAANTCTPATASSTNAFTAITCAAVPAEKVQISTLTSIYTELISNGNVATTSGVTTSTTGLLDFSTAIPPACFSSASKPPLPTALVDLPAGCSAWPCSVTTAFAGNGSTDSLADVAQYYYVNDLRPDFYNTDLTGKTTTALITAVGPAESDRALWQHMTTFTMGLGVSGTLDYRDDYLSAGTGAFAAVRAGTQNWQTWPVTTPGYFDDPGAYNDPRSIDDFWHTAVNGRGQYFSADKPQKVIDGVASAITSINAALGAGSGFSASNNTPVSGDNAAYLSSFVSGLWTGDITRNSIINGVISSTTTWSAQSKLDAQTSSSCDNRTIYYRTPGNATLTEFTWNTKKCDTSGLPTGAGTTGLTATEQAYFDATEVASFTQYAAMTDGTSGSANQRTSAAGANLLNYLRGQRGLEGFTPNDAAKLYRARDHVLGDIVGSVIAVVKKPDADYADTGYAGFVTANAARTTTLYVGSNSGMLHAIDAETGTEKWAFVPRAVMPELYRLADTAYEVNHRYFVDGSPSVGDVYDVANSSWKTILVGGLGKGGKGYYALDVTNPNTPKPLWEFNQSASCGTVGSTSDCDLGLSYGRPLITKLLNGTWVVMFTSGYNNVTNGGSGKGFLYLVNAITGAIISKIDTGVGSTGTPSGLRDINNYVANGRVDNTTLRVYGGDLLGNVWRFDVNDTIAPAGLEATLIATTKDALGAAQPITTRVQLAEVDGLTFVVAATGQLLSVADSATTQQQTIYGFKDTLVATSPQYGSLRASLKPITLTRSGTTGNVACTGSTSACALSTGWYLDLPETSERINVDPLILASTVIFASNAPVSGVSTSCEAGRSYLNAIDLVEGTGRLEGGGASAFLFNQLSVGLSFLLDSGTSGGTGSGSGIGIIGTTGNEKTVIQTKVTFGTDAPLGRRVSWREIIRP